MKVNQLMMIASIMTAQTAYSFEGSVNVRNIRGSCNIGTIYQLNQVESKAIELAKAVATAEADGVCLYYGGAVRKSNFRINCTHEFHTSKVTASASFDCKSRTLNNN